MYLLHTLYRTKNDTIAFTFSRDITELGFVRLVTFAFEVLLSNSFSIGGGLNSWDEFGSRTFQSNEYTHATPYFEPIEKITISLEYMFYAGGDL